IRKYWQRERPIEIRPVSLTHYFSDSKLDPKQDVWVRATGPVPDDRLYQAAVLAYPSLYSARSRLSLPLTFLNSDRPIH
ncbi:hypothetical protein AB9F39_38750, partial [Rhizobium leguminosarum]